MALKVVLFSSNSVASWAFWHVFLVAGGFRAMLLKIPAGALFHAITRDRVSRRSLFSPVRFPLPLWGWSYLVEVKKKSIPTVCNPVKYVHCQSLQKVSRQMWGSASDRWAAHSSLLALGLGEGEHMHCLDLMSSFYSSFSSLSFMLVSVGSWSRSSLRSTGRAGSPWWGCYGCSRAKPLNDSESGWASSRADIQPTVKSDDWHSAQGCAQQLGYAECKLERGL